MKWWASWYQPEPSAMLEPKGKIEDKQVFATYHFCRAVQAGVPLVFAYSNALWLTIRYYDGDLMQLRMTRKVRTAIINGDMHLQLAKPQKEGKEWLRRARGILCGPDEFWSRIIIPIGQDFFFGTMLPEMSVLVKGGLSLQGALRYDFSNCPYMQKIREKEENDRKKVN